MAGAVALPEKCVPPADTRYEGNWQKPKLGLLLPWECPSHLQVGRQGAGLLTPSTREAGRALRPLLVGKVPVGK